MRVSDSAIEHDKRKTKNQPLNTQIDENLQLSYNKLIIN